MRFSLFSYIMLCIMYVCPGVASAAETAVPSGVTPLPNGITIKSGEYTMPESGATFYIKGSSQTLASYLQDCKLRLHQAANYAKADIGIVIKSKKSVPTGSYTDESYTLSIAPRQIRIEAQTEAGAFYAIQTLMQMAAQQRTLQCCIINDSPAYRWRGLMFDVSRHFRPKAFLLKQLDAMAMLKLNVMHLHLTDGAGWRIQIDKYPRLTEFAAWRRERKWMDWVAQGKKYCDFSNEAYGGYYTKDDIREILAYAAKRHITVIPEIEMPGHSEEVTSAYPEISCSGKAYTDYDFCAGKEATFAFLQNVLDEVIDLFPSHYIHIGGDEASKGGWHKCADCKKRMESLQLKNVDELQSYFINRIEKYVNQRGRQIIGWDEILEGGLTPNATVMSWRGTDGGIKAINDGHDAIMTPGEYCYLDYTQDAPFKEPLSIGGYTPLKQVYDYNPGATLTDTQKRHLLGIQGNLWSEYIPDESHAEYMYYPRAFAIAETGWTNANLKQYDSFKKRALGLCEMMKADGYKTFDLAHEYGNRPESKTQIDHLAKGCKVKYNIPYGDKWKAAGDVTLTDGIIGGWTYTDRRWQGTTDNMDVVVDLGAVKDIHYIGANFMHSTGPWVYAPEKVDYYVSEDGSKYDHVATIHCDIPEGYDALLFKMYGTVYNGKARYVRMVAHKNYRDGAWLFTDEIIVN